MLNLNRNLKNLLKKLPNNVYGIIFKHKEKALLTLSLFLLLGALKTIFFSREAEESRSPPPLPQSNIVVLNATQICPTLSLSGTTEPEHNVTIRAEVSGKITYRCEEKGRYLSQSSVLLRIEDNDRLERLQEAEARVKHKRAEYESAKQLKTKEFRSKNDLLSIEAELKSAVATLKKIRVEMERQVILSPFDGVLQDIFVHVGDFVSLGDKLAQFVSKRVKIIAHVSPLERQRLRLGQYVEIKNNENKAQGTITYISQWGDSKTQMFPIEVTLDEERETLPSGLPCSIVITLDKTWVYQIPFSALVLNDAGVLGIKVQSSADPTQNVFMRITPLQFLEKVIWIPAKEGENLHLFSPLSSSYQ